MSNKILFETVDYQVVVGRTEAADIDMYLCVNKMTGVTEHATAPFPTAISVCKQLQTNLDRELATDVDLDTDGKVVSIH